MGRLPLLPTAAALLLLLGACGGGPSNAPSDGGPLPVDEPAGADIRLNTDGPGREASLVPRICCAGDRVYAVWYDRRDGLLDVYFNRSTDRGATWLAADVRLDGDAAGAANSLIPQICCSGQRVYVVWYDDRGGAPDIYFNRSLDGGLTWLPSDRRIDTDTAGAAQSREPRICCDGLQVCVAWHDDRDGSFDIRANRSLDGGDSWLAADVRVDRDPGMSARAELVQLCCSGPTVHAAWVDERHGGRAVYASRSTDAGANWAPQDTRLDTVGTNPGSGAAPALACAGARVYVAWADARSGATDVRLNRSADAGANWLAGDARLDTDGVGAAGSSAPSLCAHGASVHAVWIDDRNGLGDVYYNRSLDGGGAWLPMDVRIGTDFPGVNTSFEPRVACSAERVCVVWRDDRDGRFDVFLSHSLDDGANWTEEDIRLDTDPAGAGHSIAPELCCVGDEAHVVWHDQRDGPGDVYFNRVRLSTDPLAGDP